MEKEPAAGEQPEYGWLTRALAWRCEKCPLCRYARSNPHTMLSKVMHWHGRFCPAWRAHVKVYGRPESR